MDELEKRGPGRPRNEDRRVKMLLTSDYWGEQGRVKAGTHVHLPVEEAKRILSLKIAERADDL